MAELTFYNSVPSDLKITTTFGIGCLVIKGCIDVYDILPATETQFAQSYLKSASLPKDEQEILLEHRADGDYWGTPGGRLEPGENIVQCAIREVKEETNLDIDIVKVFSIISDPQYGTIRKYPTDSACKQMIDILLLAHPTSFDIIKSEESRDVKFFKFSNLPKNITPPSSKAIKDYQALYGHGEHTILL